MCESSGLKFFGTTTEIQSGANAFEESRFVVNFLTILGVTTILCNFSLVPGGKTCREILESSRLEFLENFNQTVLLYLIQKTTASHQKSQEPSFWVVINSFVLVNISKLVHLTNPFAMIGSPFELYFRFRRFILLLLTKKK